MEKEATNLKGRHRYGRFRQAWSTKQLEMEEFTWPRARKITYRCFDWKLDDRPELKGMGLFLIK